MESTSSARAAPGESACPPDPPCVCVARPPHRHRSRNQLRPRTRGSGPTSPALQRRRRCDQHPHEVAGHRDLHARPRHPICHPILDSRDHRHAPADPDANPSRADVRCASTHGCSDVHAHRHALSRHPLTNLDPREPRHRHAPGSGAQSHSFRPPLDVHHHHRRRLLRQRQLRPRCGCLPVACLQRGHLAGRLRRRRRRRQLPALRGAADLHRLRLARHRSHRSAPGMLNISPEMSLGELTSALDP